MNSEPLLTIGICCCGEGEWLRDCWESVLLQTDDHWEALLVMDGGADEATRAVFDSLEHPRLRKHSCGQRLRHGGTRNLAFELTRTGYHLYVDGDDLLVPETVAWMLNGFDQRPEAAMVYGDVEWFGDYHVVYRHPGQMTWDAMAEIEGFQGGGAAYRTDAWREMGGLAREMWASGSDYDFNIGLAEAGYRFFHVDRTVYRYRKYGNSNSENHASRCWEKHEMMVQRHPKFFADSTRRQKFLARAYAYSFRSLYEAGDLSRARDVARRALARGTPGDEKALMKLVGRMPLALFKGLRPVWCAVRSVGRGIGWRGGRAERREADRG